MSPSTSGEAKRGGNHDQQQTRRGQDAGEYKDIDAQLQELKELQDNPAGTKKDNDELKRKRQQALYKIRQAINSLEQEIGDDPSLQDLRMVLDTMQI